MNKRLNELRDKIAHLFCTTVPPKADHHMIAVKFGFDAALSELKKGCPCGGVILADTEDWPVPICNSCYEFNRKQFLSELVPLLRECRDAIQDQLARANQAIETDCPQCDYQCGGCIRSIDDMESMKKRIDATLDGIEGEKK